MTKTIHNIQSALIALLNEKELSKITVTELARKAQIQRKTFYLHYQSIDDVIADFSQKLSDDLRTLINTMHPFSVATFIVGLNDLLLKHYAFYDHVLTNNRNILLSIDSQNRLKEGLIDNLFALQHTLSPHEQHIYAEFIAAGIVSVYSNWSADPSQYSLDSVITVITKLINPIFKQAGIVSFD